MTFRTVTAALLLGCFLLVGCSGGNTQKAPTGTLPEAGKLKDQQGKVSSAQ